MSNILITGASGFVPSNCVRHFLNQGHHVVGFVKERNFKTDRALMEKCSLVYGDIAYSKELLQATLARYEIDYVLHLAASPIVRICNNNPYDAYMTNVVGTLNILEAVRNLKTRPKKVIVISSDKAYGPHSVLPYKEDAELVAFDSYCTSKSCQDFISRSYAKTYDLPIVTVRAGNIFGGDLNLSRLIPNTILKLLRGEPPTLYSGVANYVREFIYVDNIVSAFDTLLHKGVNGEAYNVGGTPPQKILDIITMLRDKINPNIGIEIIEKDFNEIEAQYLDATKLMALGWKPHINLSEGLDLSIAWYKQYAGIK